MWIIALLNEYKDPPPEQVMMGGKILAEQRKHRYTYMVIQSWILVRKMPFRRILLNAKVNKEQVLSKLSSIDIRHRDILKMAFIFFSVLLQCSTPSVVVWGRKKRKGENRRCKIRVVGSSLLSLPSPIT